MFQWPPNCAQLPSTDPIGSFSVSQVDPLVLCRPHLKFGCR